MESRSIALAMRAVDLDELRAVEGGYALINSLAGLAEILLHPGACWL